MYAPAANIYPGQTFFTQTTQTVHTYSHPGYVPIPIPAVYVQPSYVYVQPGYGPVPAVPAYVQPQQVASLYDETGKIKPALKQALEDVNEAAHHIFHTFYSSVKTAAPKFKNISLFNNCWFWDFSTTNVFVSPSHRDDNGGNNNGKIFIIVAAVVVALVTSYFLGKDIKRYQMAKQGLAAEKELHLHFMPYAHLQGRNQDAENIQKACDYSYKMFREIRNDALRSLIIKAAMIAIAVVAVAAALASAPELLAFAGYAAFVAAIAYFINKGISYGHDKQVLTYAKLLDRNPVFA